MYEILLITTSHQIVIKNTNILKFILILIIAFIKFLLYRAKRNRKATPYLIKGNIEATKSRTIYQDPNNSNSVPILRSRNEKGGIYCLFFD